MDPDLSQYPIVPLPGSEGWRSAWEWGDCIEALFPEQDGSDLAYACEYNDLGPLADHRLAGLLMLQQGERDEGEWVWLVTVDDGTHWLATGWCDYTGWDCQSGLEWEPYTSDD
jgi:hypothetical protein